MSKKINVTIDGRKLEVPYDARVLDVAKGMGIEIPTMCEHEGLKPYGVCRVCLVEMRQGKRKKLVPACVYTFRDEVEIETNSEWVQKTRRWILEFMLARSPNEKVVSDLAAKYGVTSPNPRLGGSHHQDADRYHDESACILCGLCVRTCEEVVGASAISYQGRGIERRVVSPFNEHNDACIACGACEFVCPTSCIGLVEEKGVRRMERWRVEQPLVMCRECGKPLTTRPHLEHVKNKLALPEYIYELCEDCKRRFYLEKTLSLGHM